MIWRLLNWLRGLGFDWVETHGTPGYVNPRPGTCPYPVHADWSAKGCIARGECGCDERDKP